MTINHIFRLIISILFMFLIKSSSSYAQTRSVDPIDVSPSSPTKNCSVVFSGPKQPEHPPKPFLYQPFETAWSGAIWSSTMDHTFPTYKKIHRGKVASLGEILSQNPKTCWNSGCFPQAVYYLSPSIEDYLGYDGHDGNDFATTGNALSAADGKVARIGFDSGGFGNYVDIYHEEGY